MVYFPVKHSCLYNKKPISCRKSHINLLLTEREGLTGEYWPVVVPVRIDSRSEVRTKTTEGQYSPVRLELARLVSSLLYGTRTMLVLNLPAFGSKKYTANDRFVWRNPDQERTNHNARIYLAIMYKKNPWNYIRDSGGIFFISSLAKISMTSLMSILSRKLYLNSLMYDQNIFGSSPKFFCNLRKFSENVRERSSGLRNSFG